MSFLEFLNPVSNNLVNFISNLPNQSIGKRIALHTDYEIPNLKLANLAIIGVLDDRGNNFNNKINLDSFRKNFYSLYPGNWQSNIVDLGDIEMGETSEDTHFAVSKVVTELIKKGIVPIIVGGSQDITYGMYRAYDNLDQMVNFVNIDKKFDFESDENALQSNKFLHKMLLDYPNNLFNYTNIGFQTFLNAQEEIDLMEKMHFDAYRLGEVSNDLSITEPVFRDADLVSVDLTSVKSSDSSNFVSFSPNGFDGKEICTLVRYAGISDRITSIGIFNMYHTSNEFILISQMVWYFIEGYNCRSNEYPFKVNKNATKFIVMIESNEIIFYKSNITGRWWMEMLNINNRNNNFKEKAFLPCSYEDYLNACNQEIPERWWKAQKKSLL